MIITFHIVENVLQAWAVVALELERDGCSYLGLAWVVNANIAEDLGPLASRKIRITGN